MNVTEQHLHHMAKKLHHTNSKLAAIKDKFSGVTERAVRTVEVGAGAWLGGLVEGRTGNGTVMHVPINLGVGIALSAAGYLDLAGKEWSGHLNNFGDGFIASYVCSHGFAFGQRWKETGKVLSGGAKGALPAPAVKGSVNEQDMAAIVANMQHAAAAAAHG